MNYSVQEYKALTPLVFPLKLGTGFTITELQGQCTNCNDTLVDIRGEVFEHGNCSEVQFAGLCHDCKLLVTCRFRYYNDGHVLTVHGEKWVAMSRCREATFFVRIKKSIDRLLDWIFGWRQ